MSLSIQDHPKPQPVTEEWPDHLARRLMPPTKRLNALALSHDGRIALGLSSTVSVLNPALVFRVVKAPAPVDKPAERKPLDFALLDSESRVARGIRPPVVGHEIAFEPEHRKPRGSRKDTTLGRGDIAHVSWTSSSTGSVMFVVNGEGYCFVAVPRYADPAEESDGAWGGLLGSWQYKRMFPQMLPEVLGGGKKGSTPGSMKNFAAGASPNSTIGDSSLHGGWRRRGRGSAAAARLEQAKDLFPQNQIRCVSFVRVFKTSEAGSECGSQVPAYIVLGRKDGTFMFSFEGWKGAENIQEPVLSLHSGWSASLACLEDVAYGGKSVTLIAVGGAFGEVILYGVWFEHFSGDLFMLTSKALWRAESSLLFGPVASLSWSCYQSNDQLRLAVGSGNCITVLDWSNISSQSSGPDSWANPEVHKIPDAHDSVVSSLQVLVDGTFVSSSLDGKVYRWMLTRWGHGSDSEKYLYCGQLHSGRSSEPVMGLDRTPCGFGVTALTTTIQTYSEVQDPNDDGAKAKYGAGSRRSLLSLYIQPSSRGIPDVISLILMSVDLRATRRRYIGEAMVSWDVELLLEQLEGDDENKVLSALRQRFYDMLKQLESKSIPNLSEKSFYHFSRMALSLSQLIVRTGGTDINAIESMEPFCNDISNCVRFIHYDACLNSFLRGSFDVKKLTDDEFQSLESMCQFSTTCKPELCWDATSSLEHVRLVRQVLSLRVAHGDSTTLLCPICEPESAVPLVSDAGDAGSFYCSSNDCFARCVLTGLPCTDVVPLVCHVCEAKAVARDFDPYRERGEKFKWIEDIGRCPMCLCPLLPSSVEIQ